MKKFIVLTLTIAASAAYLITPAPAQAGGSYNVWYEPCYTPVRWCPLCIPNGSDYCPTNQCWIYA